MPAITILHRDEHLVVVDKPSGLAVHRGWAADRVTAMSMARDAIGQHVFPVHRLDRGTSGVLAFALDPGTAALLQEQLKGGDVEKRYLALVRGVIADEGRIDHPIPRQPDGPRVDAVTRFRRLAVALDRFSLIEAIPETGRLHQIRRHMKHLSHPVMGDSRYGDGKENRRLRDGYGLHRLALHAARLSFAHPRSAVWIDARAPLPDDLRGPLERMGFALDRAIAE